MAPRIQKLEKAAKLNLDWTRIKVPINILLKRFENNKLIILGI